MITEAQEVARHRVAERVRTAETRARRREQRSIVRASPGPGSRGPRHELAGILRRLADRLEPPRCERRTGLSVVR